MACLTQSSFDPWPHQGDVAPLVSGHIMLFGQFI